MKHSPARRIVRFFPALLAVGLLTAATPTFAQPGNGGNRGGNNRGGNRPDRAAMQAQMLQRQLERAGYTDPAIVEAVTTYMTDREAERQSLRSAANALSEALADENSTDAEITQLTDAFDAALATEKTRTLSAEAALDKQINFSKEPKLKAVLMLSGVIGEGAAYLGPQGGGRGGRGGMGGPGGGGPDGMGGGPGGPDGMGGPGGGG